MKLTMSVLLAGSMLLATPLAGWAEGIVADKSEISFISKQNGAPTTGRFKKFDADIVFKPNDLAGSHAKLEIDLASIDLASEESETEVKRKGWFNVALFPKATFASSAIRASSADHYDVVGKLSIKGLSRDLTVPISVRKEGAATLAEGSFVLKRLDFLIGEGPWSDTDVVANDVQVKFHLLLTGGGK